LRISGKAVAAVPARHLRRLGERRTIHPPCKLGLGAAFAAADAGDALAEASTELCLLVGHHRGVYPECLAIVSRSFSGRRRGRSATARPARPGLDTVQQERTCSWRLPGQRASFSSCPTSRPFRAYGFVVQHSRGGAKRVTSRTITRSGCEPYRDRGTWQDGDYLRWGVHDHHGVSPRIHQRRRALPNRSTFATWRLAPRIPLRAGIPRARRSGISGSAATLRPASTRAWPTRWCRKA
jgi:hypothetical protein